MRRLLYIIAVTAIAACSQSQVSAGPSCADATLSKAELLQVVKDEFKTSGLDPKVLDDEKRVKVEMATADCDYLVRVTSLPEKPGGFTIYRISRAKKIINVLAGD